MPFQAREVQQDGRHLRGGSHATIWQEDPTITTVDNEANNQDQVIQQ